METFDPNQANFNSGKKKKKRKPQPLQNSKLNGTFNDYIYLLMIHHLHTLLKQKVI